MPLTGDMCSFIQSSCTCLDTKPVTEGQTLNEPIPWPAHRHRDGRYKAGCQETERVSGEEGEVLEVDVGTIAQLRNVLSAPRLCPPLLN